MPLTKSTPELDQERYIRQITLTEFGVEGQDKLAKARVIVVGCGGLGTIVAPYLAGAGIGEIILIDGDKPQKSNLHRQVLFTTHDFQNPKATLLKRHLNKLNPDIDVTAYDLNLDKNNITDIIRETDIVVECTDNIHCKYLVNDFCHLNHIPLVYGSIYKYEGHVSLFRNKSYDDVHLRDAFPVIQDDIPRCSDVGVMNTIAGIIGLLQANEVLKYLVGIGKSLFNDLLIYNVLDNEQIRLKLKKNWKGDMFYVFRDSKYISQTCSPAFEIDITYLQKNIKIYTLVSILEKEEHLNIFDDAIHQPYSTIEIDKWIHFPEPVVFYCSAGIRSGLLVSELRSKNPSGEFYSLRNGIKNLKSTE